MSRPTANPNDQEIESWEIAFDGSVSIWVYDRRNDEYKKQVVAGHYGSRTMHLSRDDRKYNQELIPDECKHLDPFINGQLRLLGASADRDENLDVRNHYSNDELATMFEVRDPELFREAMEGITSEVVLRRLQNMAETHATVAQNETLRDLIQRRYPVGGTQTTVKEMIEAGDRIGATRI